MGKGLASNVYEELLPIIEEKDDPVEKLTQNKNRFKKMKHMIDKHTTCIQYTRNISLTKNANQV